MKLLRMIRLMILAVAATVLLGGVASSQDINYGECTIPYRGYWSAPGGGFLEGRISESWCYSPYTPGEPGNTLNAMSWDGCLLGTQWKIWGMVIDAAGAVEVGSDINEVGFGWIDYVTNYEGGRFWLNGDQAWSDGTNVGGDVVRCNVNSRVTLVNFQPVALTSNIHIVGVFDVCEICLIEIAANSTRLWMSGDEAPMPTGYPSFLCDAQDGELHYSCCIIAEIDCSPTGAEESSWGTIKDMYR